jgi:TetR/AcrR family transcriptional regulator, transcriptional repressor of bet genes
VAVRLRWLPGTPATASNRLIPLKLHAKTRKTRRVAARRRTAPRAERREQLIRATIRCVAKRGLADTTIATVASEAGLSQGIINLHFQSKERLLTETLRYLADEYLRACRDAAAAGGESPEAGLKALVDLDFRRDICDRSKLAVWFAFWGEARFRPTYRRICAARDESYDDLMRSLCAQLCERGSYRSVDPALVADGLSALTDGLWLDLLVRPDSMNPGLAWRISMAYLADAFPRHFERPAAKGSA